MSCLTTVFSLGFSIVLTGGILAVVEQSHAGSDAAAIEALEDCSAVTEVLGSPIEENWGPPGCGEYEGGGGSATSSFTIPVKGPKGKGSLTYAASHTGGPWKVNAARVSTSSGTIVAVPCSSGSSEPKPKPDGDRRRKRRRKPR